MKTVLLIIDLQQDFFIDGLLHEHQDNLIESVNELIDKSHENNIPVIWVRQEYKYDLSDAPLYNRINKKAVTIEGTEGCLLLSGLHRNKNDYEIIKKRYSAFFKTELEKLLKDLKVETIIIAGVNTMTCVRVTAIDAYQRDYKVILALDCIDSYDVEQHENSVKYLQYAVANAKSNSDLLSFLNKK